MKAVPRNCILSLDIAFLLWYTFYMMTMTQTQPSQISQETQQIHRFRLSFMSSNARALFQIAIHMAGYHHEELWQDIIEHARNPKRITETQVENAMGRCK